MEAAWPTRVVEVKQQGAGQGERDADRMAQVMQNLITNALKYSPEDSQVRVVTRAEKAEVLLSVANQGPPIPEDKLASIFEPMQRATDAHGGRIGVVSTPEEGTRFTVHLPRQGHATR